MTEPSPKGPEGRDPTSGRFLPGWKGGPGNPYAAKVAKLREALLDAITPQDIRDAVAALVKECKAGNVIAIRELLNRAVGEPLPADMLERLEELERLIETTPTERTDP